MNRHFLIVWAGIGLLLGGCSLAPEYIAPKAPVPDQWPRGPAYRGTAAGSGTAAPMLAWKDFFADQRLQKIILMALENNRNLRLAALNVERARAMYGIQRAERFPAVNAVGSAAARRVPADLSSTGRSETAEHYGVDLGIAAWEIDFFGRIRSLKDQALEAYLATEQARRSAEIALMAEVAGAWLTLAADRENRQMARATLETQQAAFDLIQKSHRIGFATDIDLRRAQIQVDAARRDIPRYHQRVAQDQNALNLLAGTPVPENLMASDLGGLARFGDITPGLPSAALLNRPDIMAAEHRLKGANAIIGAARAALFPRISLTTAFGTASAELSGLFNAGSETWTFAPQVAMPIFDARTWAALRVSKADRKMVLARYEKAIQTAFREVADTLAVQGAIEDQLSAQTSLVAGVAETHRLANKRYALGLENYLGVLDAQRSLYRQRQAEISLRLSGLANQVRLYAVLGGGTG
jgi:outer membrane protein, multidrug efflux system